MEEQWEERSRQELDVIPAARQAQHRASPVPRLSDTAAGRQGGVILPGCWGWSAGVAVPAPGYSPGSTLVNTETKRCCHSCRTGGVTMSNPKINL